MSHYDLLALVPKDQDIDIFLSDKMAPYSIDEKVPEYERQCSCVEYKAHRDVPDPNCPICHGTGKELTNKNPQAKWDWYEIGGRWSGRYSNDIQDAVAAIGAIQSSPHTPFVVLTPDGQWYEQGKMFVLGRTYDDLDQGEWDKTVMSLIETHKDDCLAVIVDCHI